MIFRLFGKIHLLYPLNEMSLTYPYEILKQVKDDIKRPFTRPLHIKDVKICQMVTKFCPFNSFSKRIIPHKTFEF